MTHCSWLLFICHPLNTSAHKLIFQKKLSKKICWGPLEGIHRTFKTFARSLIWERASPSLWTWCISLEFQTLRHSWSNWKSFVQLKCWWGVSTVAILLQTRANILIQVLCLQVTRRRVIKHLPNLQTLDLDHNVCLCMKHTCYTANPLPTL